MLPCVGLTMTTDCEAMPGGFVVLHDRAGRFDRLAIEAEWLLELLHDRRFVRSAVREAQRALAEMPCPFVPDPNYRG